MGANNLILPNGVCETVKNRATGIKPVSSRFYFSQLQPIKAVANKTVNSNKLL